MRKIMMSAIVAMFVFSANMICSQQTPPPQLHYCCVNGKCMVVDSDVTCTGMGGYWLNDSCAGCHDNRPIH